MMISLPRHSSCWRLTTRMSRRFRFLKRRGWQASRLLSCEAVARLGESTVEVAIDGTCKLILPHFHYKNDSPSRDISVQTNSAGYEVLTIMV